MVGFGGCSFAEPSLEVCLMSAAEATEVVSQQSLRLLKTADSFVSIPGVGAAAKAAVGILSVAQVCYYFYSYLTPVQ
jgi:hypothetical protein